MEDQPVDELTSPLSDLSYEQQCSFLSPIAQPLASEKLTKRLFKLMRKAKRTKSCTLGVKAVIKDIIKRNESGIVVLAGNISPIDTIAHVPVTLEEHDVPYCYVPSYLHLSANYGVGKTTFCILIKKHEDYEELYDKCYKSVDDLPLPIS
ncbi:unnamed protein product [Protopolystoma xenopodis]|uniref:Ribosomal protein eL8/eL30/eS12/Gadd45 domain-containing protein n=1 Tax=Protopolystoma xenopodis TaxID=117903 RepID=A0A3S5CJF9_9PLAT|nr:unnamed protein product [Protopolystoma xenopodis]